MSDTSVDLLPDLPGDDPCGPNLEDDPDFAAMERASEGTPETQYGDTINAAIPPEWKEVVSVSTALLDRTRDLRVLVHRSVARLNMADMPGFAGDLTQIRHLLEHQWEMVHPRLDPEDDNDPLFRSNTLKRLQDPRSVLRTLREMTLARTPAAGTVTWRDIAASRNEMDPESGREKMTEAFIRGVFNNTAKDRLQTLREAFDVTQREVSAIPAAFDARTGGAADFNLADLVKLVDGIQKDLRRYEPVEEAEQPVDEQEEETGSDPTDGTDQTRGRAPARRGPISARSLTSLASRDEALYLLDLVSGWFRENEPSSPVPLLVDRARRLGSMDFLDILRDMAPEGMGQAHNVAGIVAEPPPE